MSERFTFTDELTTPAIVFDIDTLYQDLSASRRIVNVLGGTLLYSIKACSVPSVLSLIASEVAGFACSSPNEMRLARRFAKGGMTIHLTSPGLCPEQVRDTGTFCDYVSFNSASQYKRLAPLFPAGVSCGLRVNPETAFVADSRYDPCRRDSKLGTSLHLTHKLLKNDNSLKGIHVHNNCESSDLCELGTTLKIISEEFGTVLDRLDWINLGGGYLLPQAGGVADVSSQFEDLASRFDLEFFLEPGAAIVRKSGKLISRVVDIIRRGRFTVAILDTTVNHWPEVFEYQFQPDVAEAVDAGPFEYILGGCSCLAGDLFGRYEFAQPLEIGSQITFEDAGAYSFVKSHYFNGITLPTIYMTNRFGHFEMIAEFRFKDYLSHVGGRYNYALASD